MDCKKVLITCLVGTTLLSILSGCGNKTVVNNEQSKSENQAKYEEYKNKQVDYINESDAKEIAKKAVDGYQKKIDAKLNEIKNDKTSSAATSGTTTTSENKKVSKLVSMSYDLKDSDSDYHKEAAVCGNNNENYECINNPEDSYYLFRVYDIYNYEDQSTENLSPEYSTKNILVNKITGEIEITDTKEFNTIGTDYDGTYSKVTGDATISIEGSNDGYIFNYETTVNGTINGMTGLASKDVIKTVYVFDYNSEKVYFRFGDNTLNISTDSTDNNLITMCGDYKK